MSHISPLLAALRRLTTRRLRDRFAGQAMAAIIGDQRWQGSAQQAAEWAYRYADEMLAARRKKGGRA